MLIRISYGQPLRHLLFRHPKRSDRRPRWSGTSPSIATEIRRGLLFFAAADARWSNVEDIFQPNTRAGATHLQRFTSLYETSGFLFA